MRRAKHFTLNRSRRLLPAQDCLLRSDAIVKGIFGGWGSGKTRGAALELFRNCIANPFDNAIHTPGVPPFSLVVGYTRNVLKDSAYRELMDVIPPDAIAVERKSPSWEIVLKNGHEIHLRTIKGALEGASCCGVWIDEGHKIPDEGVFLNYQMRARDGDARRFLVIVSGLPMDGWLKDTFDQPNDADRVTIMARTADNHYLPPHVIKQFRKSASKKKSIALLGDGWIQNEENVFHEFSRARHVVNDPGDRSQPVHIGFDNGDKGIVLLLQERIRVCKDEQGKEYKALGLHVVAEIVTECLSVEQQMRAAQGAGWLIAPNVSKIFTDPTIRADEISAIRRVFGNTIGIITQKRGTDQESVDYGINAVNAAFADADDNIRLTLSDQLDATEERGLIKSLLGFKKKKNGNPNRDNTVDHACDGLRYPVVGLIPLPKITRRRAA